MDDLNEKLTALLTSPEGMAKIQAMMSAFGEAAAPPPTPPPAPATEGLPDLTALTKVLPLLSGLGQEDEDTRLLQALRPYLHGQREKRLDESVRLLKLLRLMPLLQEQGILGGGDRGK